MSTGIVVDRVEGEMAVLEVAGRRVDFPLVALPDGVREGDILEFRRIDATAAQDEAARVLEQLKQNWPQGPETIDL